MREPPESMSEKYRLALASGHGKRARFAPAEVQAQRFKEGMIESLDAVALVKRVLLEIGVPLAGVMRYMPFGMRLARICRRYEARTRANLALALVTQWVGRLSLRPATLPVEDSVVLFEVCKRGFGIEFDSGEERRGEPPGGRERQEELP